MTAYVPEEFTSDGGRRPAAVLHQPRRAGVRPGQPARGRQGRAVRPLQPQPEEPAPAVPRRVRRRPRHLRRPDDRRHRRPRRAEELYEKVFFEYGDDSVAQLGGVHLACEQASNLLTKVLEWGRLMSYLEQSTRYIAYDARLGGRYRYYRDPAVLASRLGTRYVGDMDRLFDAYSQRARARSPTTCGRPSSAHPDDSDFVFRQATRAKALDAVRGHPAGGVAVQRRHLRHRAGVRGAAAADARPPAARGPRLRRADAPRAAQGDPELPAPRRPRRARRPLERPTWPTTRDRTAELVESLFGDDAGRRRPPR